nr:sensor histidine kinase [Geodermatophilus sabuli]
MGRSGGTGGRGAAVRVTTRTPRPAGPGRARVAQNGGSVGRAAPAIERAGPVESAERGDGAPTSAPPDRRPVAAGRFRHAAAVVTSDAELLAVALPFLQAGVRAGDLVAMTCPPDVVELVCAELGEAGPGVEADTALSLLGARAPDVLSSARRFVQRAEEAPSGRLRVLSVVDFGDRPAGWREGLRYESASNRLLQDDAVTSVCVYDRRRLVPEVVASAGSTHPELVQGHALVPSPAFRDPLDYIPALPWPRDPVEDTPPALVVGAAASLAGLRHAIGAVLAERVPDRDQREDLHLATSEVAANAFRHGRPPVSARLWTDGSQMVCAITDAGRQFGDPLAGFRPAHGDDLSRGGMGLWLARKLWDSVDLLPGADGLTVRLSTRLR